MAFSLIKCLRGGGIASPSHISGGEGGSQTGTHARLAKALSTSRNASNQGFARQDREARRGPARLGSFLVAAEAAPSSSSLPAGALAPGNPPTADEPAGGAEEALASMLQTMDLLLQGSTQGVIALRMKGPRGPIFGCVRFARYVA